VQLEVKVTAHKKEIWSLVAIGRVTWHQGHGCDAREFKLKSNGEQERDAREEGGLGRIDGRIATRAVFRSRASTETSRLRIQLLSEKISTIIPP
jgi:hypothetical protein